MSVPSLVLNHWLQTADHNYISGRFLWTQWLITGARSLLWLSIEQLIKIVILQSQAKQLLAPNCSVEEAHRALDKAAFSIARNHSRDEMVAALTATQPSIDLVPYADVTAKLEEYYRRRYPVNGGSSIGLNLLHQADALYFYLRSHVEPEIGLGVIDEIVIRRKHGWGQPLQSFEFAYRDNTSFVPRRYDTVNWIGPDGRVVTEDGSAW